MDNLLFADGAVHPVALILHHCPNGYRRPKQEDIQLAIIFFLLMLKNKNKIIDKNI